MGEKASHLLGSVGKKDACTPNYTAKPQIDGLIPSSIIANLSVHYAYNGNNGNHSLQGAFMNTALLNLPTGAALEREINEIEAYTHDERIRQTMTERIAIANDPNTVLIPHTEVFAQSRIRLMAGLTKSNE